MTKQVNPEFKEFINKTISKIENLLRDIEREIADQEYEPLYKKKINEILNDIENIKQRFELYSSKFKYYTEDTERALRKFGFLMGELIKELDFNKEAFKKENNEIYLLNIVNKWSVFNSNVKESFYDIENSDYPYTIHTIFSLAFVLVPFLNIFSLVGGIYLIRAKDWRALTFGTITLILYFLQIINVIFLSTLV